MQSRIQSLSQFASCWKIKLFTPLQVTKCRSESANLICNPDKLSESLRWGRILQERAPEGGPPDFDPRLRFVAAVHHLARAAIGVIGLNLATAWRAGAGCAQCEVGCSFLSLPDHRTGYL